MPEYLSLATLKADLRIDHDDDDANLTLLLDSAEAFLGDVRNGVLGRPVLAAEYVETFSGFDAVDIAHPDEVSALAVSYTDDDGNPVTLGDVFTVNGRALKINYQEAWPSHRGPVTVTYTAGWDVADVPEPIRGAGYFIAGQMYDHRHEFDAMRHRHVLAMMLAGYRRVGL